MTLQELETKKEELISKFDYDIKNEKENNKKELIIKLLRGTHADDADLKEVLEDGTGEALINILIDCYDTESLISWLVKNGFDLFNDYRFSERRSIEDYMEDIERYKEACYNYNFDYDHYSSLSYEEKKDYIKETFDGLTYSENMLVFSW